MKPSARPNWDAELRPEGIAVARGTVARLVPEMEFQGAVRGRLERTPVSDKVTPCPSDDVNREFWAERPNKRARVSC